MNEKAEVVWYISFNGKIVECPNKCRDIHGEVIGERIACELCGYWLVIVPWTDYHFEYKLT